MAQQDTVRAVRIAGIAGKAFPFAQAVFAAVTQDADQLA